MNRPQTTGVLLAMCRLAGVEPSILPHQLDFPGREDCPNLGFFPAMDQPAAKKLRLVAQVLDTLRAGRRVLTMRGHADHLVARLPRLANA